MKRTLLLLAIAGCGSKSAPSSTIDNTAGSNAPSSTAIPSGLYDCRFTGSGYTFDPYRCDVGEGAAPSIEKVGGYERFTGTLSASGRDLVIDGNAMCDDGSEGCHYHFTGTLTWEDDGQWKGELSGPSDWWLDGGELEVSYDPDGTGLGYGGYGGYDDEPEGD